MEKLNRVASCLKARLGDVRVYHFTELKILAVQFHNNSASLDKQFASVRLQEDEGIARRVRAYRNHRYAQGAPFGKVPAPRHTCPVSHTRCQCLRRRMLCPSDSSPAARSARQLPCRSGPKRRTIGRSPGPCGLRVAITNGHQLSSISASLLCLRLEANFLEKREEQQESTATSRVNSV